MYLPTRDRESGEKTGFHFLAISIVSAFPQFTSCDTSCCYRGKTLESDILRDIGRMRVNT